MKLFVNFFLRTADSVTGFSEREILQDLGHLTLNLVRIKEIQTQYQIDLVNLSDMRVEYQGTVYRYVLSIMDIFSRFHW